MSSLVCTVVQYAVRMTGVYGKTENSTPPLRKYRMDKDIQTPPRIYDYVAELSCCAQSEQNRLTQYWWGNRGNLSFFTHTHTHTHSNDFFHLAYRSQIWKDLKHLWLKTRGFTSRCAFLGIVDDKSCLGVQIPQKPIFGGPFNAKPIIERALRKSQVNGATMLKLYSYIGTGKYLGTCQNFSARGRP